MKWETVIGLEVHAQLLTESKIFSDASARYCDSPNLQACEIDLGLPGVLPTLNRDAVAKAILFGIAVGATVNRFSEFARKNYFYPDLPKGYQISQYEYPILTGGLVTIDLAGGEKTVRLIRAHLEEDAGKLIHDNWGNWSGVDLNRAGTPLLEIVSEPDLRTAAEAAAYARALHSLARYLNICDGNMQEGSFRIDANISVRRREGGGDAPFGTRCEIKNLNSFRFLEQAIEFESRRQIAVIEGGGKVAQETRLFDSQRGETRPMRSKEEAHDYRYFPDPDLPPLVVADSWIEEIRRTMPELPDDKRRRFAEEFGLSSYDAATLTAERDLAEYFEAVARQLGDNHKLCANWVLGEFSAHLNKNAASVADAPPPPRLAELLARIIDNTISGKIAKAVFEEMWESGESADSIIEKKGLRQITDDSALEKTVNDIIAAHPNQVAQYRAGKEKLLGFFVGQVMKATQGKANPNSVNQTIRSKLAKN